MAKSAVVKLRLLRSCRVRSKNVEWIVGSRTISIRHCLHRIAIWPICLLMFISAHLVIQCCHAADQCVQLCRTGLARMHQKEYAKAQELFQRAIDFSSALSDHHKCEVSGWFYLGQSLAAEGKREEALQCLKQALRLRQKYCLHQDQELAVTLFYMAQFEAARGNVTTAITMLYRSLAIARATDLERHTIFASISWSLAELLLQRRQYSTSIPLYKDALRLAVVTNANILPSPCTIIDRIAVAYEKIGTNDELKQFLLSELGKAAGSSRALRKQTAEYRFKLILTLAACYKRTEDARSLEQLSRWIEHAPLEPLEKALEQGYVLYLQTRFTEAKSSYERAILLERAMKHVPPPGITWTLAAFGDLLKDGGKDIAGAIKLYEQALRRLPYESYSVAPERALLLYKLSDAYRLQKNFGRAESLARAAIDEAQKRHSRQHELVVQAMLEYARILSETGRDQESRRITEDADKIRNFNGARP